MENKRNHFRLLVLMHVLLLHNFNQMDLLVLLMSKSNAFDGRNCVEIM